MSLLLGPIDDTVQLTVMAANESDGSEEFPTDSDTARILPSTNGVDDDVDLITDGADVTERRTRDHNRSRRPRPPCRSIVIVIILTFVNLLNYMDRFTIAGELHAPG